MKAVQLEDFASENPPGCSTKELRDHLDDLPKGVYHTVVYAHKASKWMDKYEVVTTSKEVHLFLGRMDDDMRATLVRLLGSYSEENPFPFIFELDKNNRIVVTSNKTSYAEGKREWVLTLTPVHG